MEFQLINTIQSNQSFNDVIIKKVWEKAEIDSNYNPNEIRKDICGAYICFDLYGQKNKTMGWQIDCIKPIEYGGNNELFNLQPLNWKNKASKKNNYPSWVCTINTIS